MITQRLAQRYFGHRRKKAQRWLDAPIKAQYDMLAACMPILSRVKYGQQYAIAPTDDYQQFASKLPCVFYEDIAPYITDCRKGQIDVLWHRPIKWFAKSSGTTNAQSKFIPLSSASLSQNHMKAGKDLLAFYFANHPTSKIFGGKTFRLGGSHEVYSRGKSRYGDLSAALIEHLPFWAKRVSTPSKEISLMADWEPKLRQIVAVIANQDVRVLAGVPSWMLMLLRAVLQAKGQDNFREIWPGMELYLHGGINFDPYYSIYQELFPHLGMNYVDIYNASEGFFAFQDQKETQDLLLLTDHGVFY